MTSTQSADILWYLLALLLVGSALLNRRISFRHGLGLVLIWIAIFGLVAVAYSHRRTIAAYFTAATQPAAPTESNLAPDGRPEENSGQIVRIEQSPDGHFWVDGVINGHPARFMIDSGATITALSSGLAQSAGLNVDLAGPGVALRTANGAIIAHRSSVGTLAVGPIQASDISVVVSDAFGDMNVIGMNFLSQLRSWRVENGEMILES